MEVGNKSIYFPIAKVAGVCDVIMVLTKFVNELSLALVLFAISGILIPDLLMDLTL